MSALVEPINEDTRWVLDPVEVTMLRGVAYVGEAACHIDINLDESDATLTVGGDDGEEPTVVHVPVAIDPETRQRVHESIGGTLFHIGASLCWPDTGININDLPGFRRVR